MLTAKAGASRSLAINISAASSIISSNLTSNPGRHRRQSSVNAVSWNETVSVQCPPPINSPEGSNEVCLFITHSFKKVFNILFV